MRRTRRTLRTWQITAALTLTASLAGCGLFDTIDEIDNFLFRPFQPCCDRYGDGVDWVGQQSMYARTWPCEWDEKWAYRNRPRYFRIPNHYKIISQIGNEEPDDSPADKKSEPAPAPAVDMDADGPQLPQDTGDQKRGE